MKKLLTTALLVAAFFCFGAANAQTPDLKFADLKGKVKTCTVYEGQGILEQYTFNDKGVLTAISDTKVPSKYVTRNAKGQIIKLIVFAMDELEEEVELPQTYEYDATGNIKKENYIGLWASGILTYFYQKGKLIKAIDDAGAQGKFTLTYKYITFDQQGNWTKRQCKISDGRTKNQTRKITYYP